MNPENASLLDNNIPAKTKSFQTPQSLSGFRIRVGQTLKLKVPSIHLSSIISFLGSLALFSFVAISSFSPINNGDFWFHLAVGRYIFETKSIPLTEIFSHTAAGNPWVAHSWLYELFLYGLYRLISWNGIVIFKVVVTLISYGIFYKTLRLFKIPTLICAVVLALVHAATVQLWMDRPQIISFLLTSLVLYFLLLAYKNLIPYKKIVFLPLLFLIWGNLHAGVLIGLILIFIFWVTEGWSEISGNSTLTVNLLKSTFFKGKALFVFLIGIASSLAGLINPNFYKSYVYFFIINPGFQNRFLEEWKSVFIHLGDPHVQIYFFFIILIIVALLIDYVILKNPLQKLQAILLPFALVFGLDALRNIALFCILALPILGISLERIIQRYQPGVHKSRLLIIKFVSLLVILCLAVKVQLILGEPSIGVRWSSLPQGAVKFLSQNNLPPNLYNPYHLGGYCMWELYPKYSVFIDSRWDPYVKDIFLDYQKVATAEPDFSEVLDKYKTDIVLIQNGESWGRWREIGSFLENSRNWAPIYYDDFATLFLRNIPETQVSINKLGYHSVLLFDEKEVFKSGQSDKAITEYLRIIESAPSLSASAHNRLGFLYTQNKEWSLARQQFISAIEINPDFPAPYYNLGKLYEEESSDYNTAMPYYEKASGYNFSPATLRLAQIYEEEFHYYSKAVTLYKKLLKGSSDEAEKKELGEKIAELQLQLKADETR